MLKGQGLHVYARLGEKARSFRLVSPRLGARGWRKGRLRERKGGRDGTSTHGWAKTRAVSERIWARSAVRSGAERKWKCAIHAKKRAVSERVLALSASRFGGERVRKRADHAKKWVFCAAMCTGKDTEGKLQKACKKR